MPQTVLITGASAGIGKEFARVYAVKGCQLILVARREDALRALAEELKAEHGTTSQVVAADLADPKGPGAVFEAVRGQQVDILVNNAGFGFHGAFATTPAERYMDMIQVNVASLVHLSRLFLPDMLARHSGGILNVASTAAFVPGPLMAVYYATKAFVLSFSEALWNEVSGSGVKVSCLCPGATITEFQVHSGMDKTNLFKGNMVMDALTVARIGVDGLERNQSVVVCGLPNKMMVATSRFVPRKLTASLVRRLQDVGPS